MVLALLMLPNDCIRKFVQQLDNAHTACQLAQTSRECRVFLSQRLVQLHQAHEEALRQEQEARRQRKRAAVLKHFEAVEDSPFYVCRVPTDGSHATGASCATQLRVAVGL